MRIPCVVMTIPYASPAFVYDIQNMLPYLIFIKSNGAWLTPHFAVSS